jgi:hypothetical protein
MEDTGYMRIDGDSDYPSVADVFYRNTDEEQVANARLIAAAPDLYDACRLAIDSMQEALDGNNPGWMDNMRADLDFIEKQVAKAEGR